MIFFYWNNWSGSNQKVVNIIDDQDLNTYRPRRNSLDFTVTVTLAGGLNHLPYLISTSVSLAVIKDFSTNYLTAFGLNQAYTSLKLRNKYNIVLIYSFRSITGNILQL